MNVMGEMSIERQSLPDESSTTKDGIPFKANFANNSCAVELGSLGSAYGNFNHGILLELELNSPWSMSLEAKSTSKGCPAALIWL